MCIFVFFFQAEDGIRYLVRSRGLGDVYKRQLYKVADRDGMYVVVQPSGSIVFRYDYRMNGRRETCLLYTSDAADDLLCVALGGSRILKKKKTNTKQKNKKQKEIMKHNTPTHYVLHELHNK